MSNIAIATRSWRRKKETDRKLGHGWRKAQKGGRSAGPAHYLVQSTLESEVGPEAPNRQKQIEKEL